MSEKIIDYKDLKIKHLTGEYQNLPSAPEPDDVLYHCKVKKLKIFTKQNLIEFFGPEKESIIDSSIKFLDFENLIQKVEDDKYQIV